MGNVVRKSLWLWVLLIILAILVLGLIFGGYRKGTKLGAPAELRYPPITDPVRISGANGLFSESASAVRRPAILYTVDASNRRLGSDR